MTRLAALILILALGGCQLMMGDYFFFGYLLTHGWHHELEPCPKCPPPGTDDPASP